MPHLIGVPPSAPPSNNRFTPAARRHELHRVVDGDWSTPPPSAAERRPALVAGLAMVATLPAVATILARWPEAPRELVAAIALLPLLALLLAAMTWRPTASPSSTTLTRGGRSS